MRGCGGDRSLDSNPRRPRTPWAKATTRRRGGIRHPSDQLRILRAEPSGWKLGSYDETPTDHCVRRRGRDSDMSQGRRGDARAKPDLPPLLERTRVQEPEQLRIVAPAPERCSREAADWAAAGRHDPGGGLRQFHAFEQIALARGGVESSRVKGADARDREQIGMISIDRAIGGRDQRRDRANAEENGERRAGRAVRCVLKRGGKRRTIGKTRKSRRLLAAATRTPRTATASSSSGTRTEGKAASAVEDPNAAETVAMAFSIACDFRLVDMAFSAFWT